MAPATGLVIGSKTTKLHLMKRAFPPILLFVLLLTAPVVLAESGAYQVEVIVFRHLDSVVEPDIVEELRSFSRYPSVIENQPDTNSPPATAGGPPANPVVSLDRDLDFSDLTWNKDLPDDVVLTPARSTGMDTAWRRLRSSRGYRPLVFAGWRQNRTDYYPPLRIHDGQLIDRRLVAPTTILVADLTASDPLAAYRRDFYRIDGTVQLRRSRFLHLYLDLEFRLPPGASPIAPVRNGAEGTQSGEPMAQIPGIVQDEPGPDNTFIPDDAHGLFRLRQNRQIRTGEIQYFDTSFFGALVLVTSISP